MSSARRVSRLLVAVMAAQLFGTYPLPSLTAFAKPADYQPRVFEHGRDLSFKGAPEKESPEPHYDAPNPADENGPLLPNGTFKLRDGAPGDEADERRAEAG